MTKGYCRFYRKPLIIWFANGFTFSDIVFDNIPKVLSLPIALSTNGIRKRAIFLVLRMSDADRCFPFPKAHRFVNGDIIYLALFLKRRSLMRNPLSAIISSPGQIRFKNPQSLVIYPSIYQIHFYSEEIHTRALKELCCLYELNVCD